MSTLPTLKCHKLHSFPTTSSSFPLDPFKVQTLMTIIDVFVKLMLLDLPKDNLNTALSCGYTTISQIPPKITFWKLYRKMIWLLDIFSIQSYNWTYLNTSTTIYTRITYNWQGYPIIDDLEARSTTRSTSI